jgi:hypothetical protein
MRLFGTTGWLARRHAKRIAALRDRLYAAQAQLPYLLASRDSLNMSVALVAGKLDRKEASFEPEETALLDHFFNPEPAAFHPALALNRLDDALDELYRRERAVRRAKKVITSLRRKLGLDPDDLMGSHGQRQGEEALPGGSDQ